MNLLGEMPRLTRLVAPSIGWLLSSEIRASAGFASSRKLLLYCIHQSLLNHRRARFMVTTEAEAMEGLRSSRPGLLIVTPNLEQGDGLALAERARAVVPDIRTIMLCDQDSDDLIVAGRSGVDAVICEQECLTADQQLRTLIITLSLGRRYRSPAVMARLDGEDQGWRNATPPLSTREQQLIDLWVEGLGDREVADRLGLSYGTVRTYGKTVRQKLGVGTRAQVVLKALSLGLSQVTGF
jgi:two-component system capsular synthesis response regulator RcsB